MVYYDCYSHDPLVASPLRVLGQQADPRTAHGTVGAALSAMASGPGTRDLNGWVFDVVELLDACQSSGYITYTYICIYMYIRYIIYIIILYIYILYMYIHIDVGVI